jgi:hypothetical protein
VTVWLTRPIRTLQRELPPRPSVPEAFPHVTRGGERAMADGLPLDVLAEEGPHQVGERVAVLLECEVAGVEQVKLQCELVGKPWSRSTTGAPFGPASREFHPPSAARTLWMAVSSVKGGSGGRVSTACVIASPTVGLETVGACWMVIGILPPDSLGTRRRRLTALPEKVQQRTVDFFGMGPVQAVRTALHRHQLASLDQRIGALCGGGEGENPVGIPMNNQCGHVNA